MLKGSEWWILFRLTTQKRNPLYSLVVKASTFTQIHVFTLFDNELKCFAGFVLEIDSKQKRQYWISKYHTGLNVCSCLIAVWIAVKHVLYLRMWRKKLEKKTFKTGLSPPVFLYWPFQGGTSVVVPYCSCCLCLYFGSAIMLVTYFVNFR